MDKLQQRLSEKIVDHVKKKGKFGESFAQCLERLLKLEQTVTVKGRPPKAPRPQ